VHTFSCKKTDPRTPAAQAQHVGHSAQVLHTHT
jgi:hypothetical protein